VGPSDFSNFLQDQYGEPTAPSVDPYSDAYNAPAPATATSETRDRDAATTRGRSRSRSPGARSTGYRSPTQKRRSPPPKKPTHAPIVRSSCSPHVSRSAYEAKKAPNPSQVLGVFGLSIRTQERDLDEEFSRFGRVEKVTIVYDQRVRWLPVHCVTLTHENVFFSPIVLVVSASSECPVLRKLLVAFRNSTESYVFPCCVYFPC
jgi:hypothetical protein